MRHRHCLLVALLATSLVGCGSRTPPLAVPRPSEKTPATTPTAVKASAAQPAPKAPSPAPSANLTVAPTEEAGIIAGLVRWEGPTDPAIKDWLPADPSALTVSIAGRKVSARPTLKLKIDETSHGVADTVVWLLKAPPGEVIVPPEPLKLTQRLGDCQPHVLAAVKGSKLQLSTADDEAIFHASGAENFDATVRKGGKPEERRLDNVGRIDIRSARAPWLSAYVLVFDHGHFDVTGRDGTFRLPAVPPGKYTVVLWHESWRFTERTRYIPTAPLQRQIEVEVGPGKGASVQWVLSAREYDTPTK